MFVVTMLVFNQVFIVEILLKFTPYYLEALSLKRYKYVSFSLV